MRGLLGRTSLPATEGMLLRPAPSVHTAFMRFPIDVVFVDRWLRVVKVVERLQPWRVASARHASATVELAAGVVAGRRIEVGDQLALENGLQRGVVQQARGRANGARPTRRARETDTPTRVLLLATDRRFGNVAATLLTRRGYVVTRGERTADVATLAARDGAEVVVLEAGPSLTVAARDAAQIEMLHPRVGVVVVGEEPDRALSAMPVLAKWGAFDELHDAIERARPGATQAQAQAQARSRSNGNR